MTHLRIFEDMTFDRTVLVCFFLSGGSVGNNLSTFEIWVTVGNNLSTFEIWVTVGNNLSTFEICVRSAYTLSSLLCGTTLEGPFGLLHECFREVDDGTANEIRHRTNRCVKLSSDDRPAAMKDILDALRSMGDVAKPLGLPVLVYEPNLGYFRVSRLFHLPQDDNEAQYKPLGFELHLPFV